MMQNLETVNIFVNTYTVFSHYNYHLTVCYTDPFHNVIACNPKKKKDQEVPYVRYTAKCNTVKFVVKCCFAALHFVHLKQISHKKHPYGC